MSVIRIRKSKNYTVMSNVHLRDKNISLKAKGLLSVALSLPDNWNYSLHGLTLICKESITAIRSAIKELCDNGYVKVDKFYPEKECGRSKIEYVYTFYEEPQNTEHQNKVNQDIENLHVEGEHIEDMMQINTKELNTDKINTKRTNTEKLNTNINAFRDGRKEVGKKTPYISPDTCTKEELTNHIHNRVQKFLAKHGGEDLEKVDELSKIIEYFYRKYRDVFGESYIILSDKAFEGVVVKFLYPSELLAENEIYYFDAYKKMIDRYFQTDFGKNSGYSHVELSLPHFMSDTVRENMAMNTLPLDNMGSAWSS